MNTAVPVAPSYNDLLAQVGASQDKDAFMALFDHFAPRVKSFLLRGGFNEAEAEETAQDTMLTVWQKAAKYDPKLAMASTWIYTIARNKKIDRQRKQRFDTVDLDELLQQGLELAAEPPSEWLQGGLPQKLQAALQDLPPEQAQLIHKAFYEDMSHGEIAAATALPLGTVKTRLRTGMAKLRQILFLHDASN